MDSSLNAWLLIETRSVLRRCPVRCGDELSHAAGCGQGLGRLRAFENVDEQGGEKCIPGSDSILHNHRTSRLPVPFPIPQEPGAGGTACDTHPIDPVPAAQVRRLAMEIRLLGRSRGTREEPKLFVIEFEEVSGPQGGLDDSRVDERRAQVDIQHLQAASIVQ